MNKRRYESENAKSEIMEKALLLFSQKGYNQTLVTNEEHNASDVYGGVTVNQIKGKWAHHEESYWIDVKTGERTNEPNKEGFASYDGSIMIEEGEFRDKQLDSVNDYLPNSSIHMNEMFETINEGGNE